MSKVKIIQFSGELANISTKFGLQAKKRLITSLPGWPRNEIEEPWDSHIWREVVLWHTIKLPTLILFPSLPTQRNAAEPDVRVRRSIVQIETD